MRELLPGRETVLSQSISNQTHAQPLRSTSQRSEILSTIGRPHPPLKSVLGLGAEGFSKPGPRSHTLRRTDPSEITTASEICSSAESPAWRTLLVTSSLTISRTSSSFSGTNKPSRRSKEWRAAKTASELGVSLRSICVTESRAGSVRVTTYPRYYVYTLTRNYYYQSERRLKLLELAYYTAHLSLHRQSRRASVLQ